MASLFAGEAGFAAFLLVCIALSVLMLLLGAASMALHGTRLGRYLGSRPLPFSGFRRLGELSWVWAVFVLVGGLVALAGRYRFPNLWLMVAGWAVLELGLLLFALAALGWVARAASYPLTVEGWGAMPLDDAGTDPRVLVARRRVLFPLGVAPFVALFVWLDPSSGWLGLVVLLLSLIVSWEGRRALRRLERG